MKLPCTQKEFARVKSCSFRRRGTAARRESPYLPSGRYTGAIRDVSLTIRAEKSLREEHPDRHSRHEEERFRSKSAKICESRARAKTAESPTDSENRSPDNKPAIYSGHARFRQSQVAVLKVA